MKPRLAIVHSRKRRLEGRAINLNGFIRTMSDIADRTLGGQVAVRSLPAPDSWNCRIDATRAEVAFLNVMLNARDAMPDGGILTIETENRVVHKAEEALRLGLGTGLYAQV